MCRIKAVLPVPASPETTNPRFVGKLSAKCSSISLMSHFLPTKRSLTPTCPLPFVPFEIVDGDFVIKFRVGEGIWYREIDRRSHSEAEKEYLDMKRTEHVKRLNRYLPLCCS